MNDTIAYHAFLDHHDTVRAFVEQIEPGFQVNHIHSYMDTRYAIYPNGRKTEQLVTNHPTYKVEARDFTKHIILTIELQVNEGGALEILKRTYAYFSGPITSFL